METKRICPSCQKTLPPNVPLGLCPECLIKSGFPTGTDPENPGKEAGFVPPPVEEIAKLFPQLEIIELIGKGGMGAVYKARQPTLDRFVALKILPPDSAKDAGFAERFNREARALARLNHPHIVAVHDFGQAGGQPYLVMEFVDGLNLRQVEQAGRLAPGQALEIVPQICEALQFAHNEGIVHRDIKPENILLDTKGRVKITDFGIAKILGVTSEKVSLTGVKDLIGTPHYMAPEQIEKPQTVDHRADIYSLGVVFYEMLTGELPLGKFAPPSRKVQVDVRLDEVVLHALEKEPELRYQQASEVKTDVETITNGPTQAAPKLVSQEQARELSKESSESRMRLLSKIAWSVTGLFMLIGAVADFNRDRFSELARLNLIAATILSLAFSVTFFVIYLINYRSRASRGEREKVRSPKSEISAGRGMIEWRGLVGAWAVLFSVLAGAAVLGWFQSDRAFSLPACLGAVFAVTVVVISFGAWLVSSVTRSLPRPLASSPVTEAQTPVNVESARRQVSAPAIGLVITGILNWLAIPLIVLIIGWITSRSDAPNSYVLVVPLAALVLSSVMIVAGLKMKRLGAYGVAVTGAILAMLVTPGNVIGLPIGIWALVVLTHREVRAAFGKNHPLPLLGTGSPQATPSPGGGAWKVAAVIAAAVMLLLAVPVGAILLSLSLPYVTRQRAQVTTSDSARVVRVEAKLRQEIEQRLSEAGWRVEGLSVSVTPNLNRAECRFGRVLKNGLSEEPFPAAIRVSPQRNNLWLVTGDGQFQFLRFSVDTSAEMTSRDEPPPLTRLVARFGPVREVTLNDIDELRGGEALDLDSGQLIDLPKDIEERPESEKMQWLKDRGADLLLDNVGGRWGLMTATANELLLRPLENGRWNTLTEEVLTNALAAEPASLEIKHHGAWRVFVLGADPQLPFTFALQTANGVRGLLQITRFTENPNSAQLRFKLIETASALDTAAPKPSFGQVVEAVLPFGAPCLNHYLQFRSGQVFTIGRGPATTEAEYGEDWKRAEEAGGVDASAIRLKDGIQLIGEGCIFTQEHDASWNSLTADEVLKQLRHTSWVSGLVEPKTRDFPITYLFKTARGECGLLQVRDVVEDNRGYAGTDKQGQGLKLRYKFVQSTLAPVASNEAKAASLRKFVRLVMDPTQMTFEGQSTTWDNVGLLLANVADRAHTVLEFAVTSDQITVAQQNEWFQKAIALARQYGFEYASFIGIHPLGSKGNHSSSAPAGRPATQSTVSDPAWLAR